MNNEKKHSVSVAEGMDNIKSDTIPEVGLLCSTYNRFCYAYIRLCTSYVFITVSCSGIPNVLCLSYNKTDLKLLLHMNSFLYYTYVCPIFIFTTVFQQFCVLLSSDIQHCVRVNTTKLLKHCSTNKNEKIYYCKNLNIYVHIKSV